MTVSGRVEISAINDLKRHINKIAPSIEKAVSRVIASGWFVLGPEVKAFEDEFAAYCGTPHCVTLANGTDALELALRSLDMGQGKKVLTVGNAGMYSTTAILATGATPVYADIQSDTLLINVEDLQCIINREKIDAIIVTHLYGLLDNAPEIVRLAGSLGIPVVEDCAQSHGAMLDVKKAGSFGDIGCFSFYPTKNLGALGDGGAIVTGRADLAEKVRQLRQYGWTSKYHADLAGGRNSRLDEMQAAILRTMLPLLDEWNRRRREIATRYTRGIVHPKVITPALHGEEYVAHLYIIQTSKRDELKQHLSNAGIPSDIHYPLPDFRQTVCSSLYKNIDKPVTSRICTEVLTLPCFPEMTDDETDIIIDHINSW